MKKLFLFALLAVTVAFVASCDTSTEATKNPDAKTEKEGSSEYPPAPKAIATADIEMLDGEEFKLEDQKGKVVLINLWAVWCMPCIKEIPHLNEMQEKYKDKGFVVVALNTGDDLGEKESVENVRRFVKKHDMRYPVGWSDEELTGAFFELGQMNGIPQNFLINREGELTGIFQGGGPKVIAMMEENVEKVVNGK